MAMSFRLSPVALPPADVPAAAERFTRALVDLTRTVWHPDCTFDSALAAICAVAADALQVERVTAWRHDGAASGPVVRIARSYSRSPRRAARRSRVRGCPGFATVATGVRCEPDVLPCRLRNASLPCPPTPRDGLAR